jgi:hypothetical protein
MAFVLNENPIFAATKSTIEFSEIQTTYIRHREAAGRGDPCPRARDNTPTMFSPSQADVRRYFCEVYAKSQAGQPLEALETIASLWIAEHPEYHTDLADVERALGAMLQAEEGKTNPFLHLSMHLSISEQCSIDQPRGIRQAVELLTHRRNSLHLAHHEAMECLGKMLWESQRAGRPPDGDAYIACVQRHATRD